MERQRYAFLIGTGRCGSTLLHEILCRHEDVGFISNVDDLVPFPLNGRLNGFLYGAVPVNWTRKGRVRFAPSEAYRLLTREISPMLSESSRDLVAADAMPWLAQRIRATFERRARAQHRPLFLHKFTGWPRAGLVHDVFPSARFVHVIRDGRAVSNSLIQMPWWSGYRGPEAWRWGPLDAEESALWESWNFSWPLLAALEWRRLIRRFADTEDAMPRDLWLNVRYEDFTAEPEREMARVLDFLGLEQTERFTRRFNRHSVDKDRIDSWREELGAKDVEAMTLVLERELSRLSYI